MEITKQYCYIPKKVGGNRHTFALSVGIWSHLKTEIKVNISYFFLKGMFYDWGNWNKTRITVQKQRPVGRKTKQEVVIENKALSRTGCVPPWTRNFTSLNLSFS